MWWFFRLLLLFGAVALSLGCSTTVSRSSLTIHEVRAGETLTAIGKRYGVKPDTLAELNDVDNPNKLEVGRLLEIPIPAGVSPAGMLSFFKQRREAVRTIRLTSAQRYIGAMVWPVAKGKVSSSFGVRLVSSFHEGLDISAAEGTPIFAAHDGIVIYSGEGINGYGNIIVLKAKGILTIYAHNQENLVGPGDKVTSGQTIGLVGSTGKTRGPHLHFEVRIRDQFGKHVPVDPMVFFHRRDHSDRGDKAPTEVKALL